MHILLLLLLLYDQQPSFISWRWNLTTRTLNKKKKNKDTHQSKHCISEKVSEITFKSVHKFVVGSFFYFDE